MSIMMVCAEASSARYGCALLKRLGDVKAFGVGDESMVNLGFEAIGRAEQMAVVGVVEVVKNYGLIRRVFFDLIEAAKTQKPNLILLMDYPEFNLKLAARLKKLGFTVYYFISPQLWAWRTSRVELIKKYIDKMLVIFPFEVEFYKGHGVSVEFLGHPLLDDLKPEYFDPKLRDFERKRFGFQSTEHVLGLMPGSRHSEIKRLMPAQLQTAQRVLQSRSDVRVVILVAPTLTRDDLVPYLKGFTIPVSFIHDEPFKMISLTDTVLVASGTATVMVGLLYKPMVVMYRMSPLSAWIAKTFVKSTPYFAMVNLVSQQRLVEERFQEDANPEVLSADLFAIMSGPKRDLLISKLKEFAKMLGQPGCIERLSDQVKPYIQRK